MARISRMYLITLHPDRPPRLVCAFVLVEPPPVSRPVAAPDSNGANPQPFTSNAGKADFLLSLLSAISRLKAPRTGIDVDKVGPPKVCLLLAKNNSPAVIATCHKAPLLGWCLNNTGGSMNTCSPSCPSEPASSPESSNPDSLYN